MFDFDRLNDGVDKLRATLSAPALARMPKILLLAGTAAVKEDGEAIAAVGVGRAPGGDKDEVCAVAGPDKIADRLPAPAGFRP